MINNYILGISCYYHDSSCALIRSGEIISALQEERFTRVKFDPNFPINAINTILKNEKITIKDISAVTFYENPNLKLERILQSYSDDKLSRFIGISKKILSWSNKKYNFLYDFNFYFSEYKNKIYFFNHHISHAASAFYPSNFNNSAILTIDGVGEKQCTTIGVGNENKIRILKSQEYPHSIGLLYSTFTNFLGFKVLSGEYKMMGLAPYGDPKYYNLIRDNLATISKEGILKIDSNYFNFNDQNKMFNSNFEDLFKIKFRKEEENIEKIHMDIAASIQKFTEDFVIANSEFAIKLTNQKNLCLAGGVALNCVANSKILEHFNGNINLWIQPASGDAGTSLGSSLYLHYNVFNNKRDININYNQKYSLLGNDYTSEEIENILKKINIKFQKLDNKYDQIADLLNKQKILGIFNGKMEYGPRALGNRSIIGDPRDKYMQKKMNLKIKFRESFRPFAPIILKEKVEDWFDFKYDSFFMLLTAKLKKQKIIKDNNKFHGIEKVNEVRSEIPAVTHLDYSARIQTVTHESNSNLYNILKSFYNLTGCPILINTSFNVRGEPIVCTPIDALANFFQTNIDYLILNDFIISKDNQDLSIVKNYYRKFKPD
tara:strand:+ start:9873 stop:11684 length:1812 start_codon:yes stop_codon:yes gene_type:complete